MDEQKLVERYIDLDTDRYLGDEPMFACGSTAFLCGPSLDSCAPPVTTCREEGGRDFLPRRIISAQ